MLEHFAYINYSESRPASYRDFLSFEGNNKQYTLKHGTIRNHFSYLKRIGKIKLEYHDIDAYYSLIDSAMTPDQAPVGLSSRGEEKTTTTITRDMTTVIARMAFHKLAAHDIHLRFECTGLWANLSSLQASSTRATTTPISKDIMLPILTLDHGIKAGITVHKTDLVIVRIACSKNPIPLGDSPPAGLILLHTSLTRVQLHLQNLVGANLNLNVPHPDTWTIVLWHLGRDSVERFNGDDFEVTVKSFTGELLRAYRKKELHGRIRIERQQNPNLQIGDLLTKRLSLTEAA